MTINTQTNDSLEAESESDLSASNIEIRCYDDNEAVDALCAAFAPFGSLAHPVDQPRLAFAMLDYTRGRRRPASAVAIHEELERALAVCESTSAVAFRPRGVTLTTPTSMTEISVTPWREGFIVKVNFPHPSKNRMLDIAASLVLRQPDLYRMEARDNHGLELSRDRIKKAIAWRSCSELGEMLTTAQEVHAAARVRAELERAHAEGERRDANLGRVVAALRDAKPYVNASSYIGESRRVAIEIDSVLADEDSAAAGEAYAELLDAARAIVEHDTRAATGGYLKPHEGQTLRQRLRAALAKVDARRRECGCQETYPQVQPGRINHGPGCARRGGGA